MPRSGRERPPGPFTAASQVPRVAFQFCTEGRRQLAALLARASPELNRPCAPPPPAIAAALTAARQSVPKTAAEWIIAAAEQQIRLLLSTRNVDPKAVPGNPANYRAAIRRLRQALKPFVSGWVDKKTAEIANWGVIDAALVTRDAELAAIKKPEPYKRRELQRNCRKITVAAQGHAHMAGGKLSEHVTMHFVWTAMDMADIKLPHPDIHPTRLRKLVFG